MTPPNEHTSEGGRDDRGVPYHAESTLSSAQVLKQRQLQRRCADAEVRARESAMQQRPRAEPHTRSQGELRKLCVLREGKASVGREKEYQHAQGTVR